MSYDMDLLDLRELAEEWRDLIRDLELAEEEERDDDADEIREDIVKYVDLAEQYSWQNIDTPDDLEKFGDGYEPTLVAESYFEDYARQMAEEIGAIDRDLGWPACHIDWEAAAESLKMDYTEVTFNGGTYLTRSC